MIVFKQALHTFPGSVLEVFRNCLNCPLFCSFLNRYKRGNTTLLCGITGALTPCHIHSEVAPLPLSLYLNLSGLINVVLKRL